MAGAVGPAPDVAQAQQTRSEQGERRRLRNLAAHGASRKPAGERGAEVVVSNGLAGGEALVIGGDTDGLREGQRVGVPEEN